MEINEFKDKQSAGKLTRREVNKAMSALGLVTVAFSAAARQALADLGQALSFTWAGYDVPELYQSYELKNGAPPDYAIYANEYEAFQKAISGFKPDLAHPCSPLVPQWRDAGLI